MQNMSDIAPQPLIFFFFLMFSTPHSYKSKLKGEAALLIQDNSFQVTPTCSSYLCYTGNGLGTKSLKTEASDREGNGIDSRV